MNYSFGNWVRRRRKALDLTQQQLAQQVGCSVSAVYKIEADERRPSRQIAELLARHLEIPAAQVDLFIKIARRERDIEQLAGLKALPVQPPVSAIPSRPSNLPVFPTLFVGREHEIDVINRQLLDPACRLLTLIGPGGVGKTRLSVEVGRRLESSFPEGIYFLPMVGTSQPESIIPMVAESLGIVFSGPADPKLQLINFLQSKKILFVFDNMEHLVAGSGLLGEILQHAPEVKMLLTSRQPVNIEWEWIFEVQGLPVPDETNSGALQTNNAASLFLQRARQASHFFSPGAEDLRAIRQICRIVDGLPLAIELAASWVRTIPVRQIALELEQNLDLLETSKQDVPSRHRSMKTVFDQSWMLLTCEEQTGLIKLAGFPNGFTRQAAEVIAGASLSLLSSLVNKSLLRYHKVTDRYDLHELIRQYALAQLDKQPDEAAQIFEKHSQYFSRWLADMEAPLKSSQQIQTSASIREETPNWLSAWRWGVEYRNFDLLRQMLPCLYWYYEIHGYYAEALASYRFAVSEFRSEDFPANALSQVDQATFAFLVDQLGWFEFRTGNIQQAEELFSESLNLATEGGDQEVLYHIHGNWGYLALLKGDILEAKRLTKESLANALALGTTWHIAIPTNVLGIVEYQQRNLEQAYQQLSEVLEIWRDVGDPRGLVFCMLYLGSVALALGKFDTVESVLQESNAIALQKMDRWALAFGLDILGQVSMAKHELDTASAFFQHSLDLSQEIGDLWGSTQTMIHWGEVQAVQGFTKQSDGLFREAYGNANRFKWLPTILEALIVYTAVNQEMDLQKKLAIAFSVLSHSAITPHVRQRAEHLYNQWILSLPAQEVEAAQFLAKEKDPKAWALEIF